VHRLILTYDSNGKVIEVKSVKESLKSQMLARISDPRLSAKEKQAIQSIPLSCWDELSQSSASYTYDSEGHVTEERNMTGKRIDRNVVRSYNDHGDLASESIDGRPVRRSMGNSFPCELAFSLAVSS
jgi:hypothetical protein